MKKIFFFVAVLAMSMTAKALEVATFENADYETAGIWTTAEAPYWYGWGTDEANYWTSGEYQFVTYADNSWGATYYYDFVVSNDASNVYTDWSHAYRSASGGAYEGANFAVWYNNWYGNSPIEPLETAVVPGFFINNCAYTVNSMCNVEGEKFGAEDYYTLIIYGILNEDTISSLTVSLAGEGSYINQWTYVDLSSLGEVDAIGFAVEASNYMTPTYFCMDNFGIEKPLGYTEPERAEFPRQEAVANTKAAVKATKTIRNGQVVILRDNKAFNILGAEL